MEQAPHDPDRRCQHCGTVLVIERKPDGLDLVFQPEKNDDAKQRRIRARWEAEDKPQDP